MFRISHGLQWRQGLRYVAYISALEIEKQDHDDPASHKTRLVFFLWQFIRPRYLHTRLTDPLCYWFATRYVLGGASPFDSFPFNGAINIFPRQWLCSPYTVKAMVLDCLPESPH
jgi:hypothetical protein